MNKTYKIILVVSLLSITVLVAGVSYAFFAANIVGNEDAELMKLDSGTIELTFVDDNTISLPNAKPGDSKSKTFTVQNTGTFDDDYTYNLFRKYTEESKKYIDLYEKKYGPLELCDSNYTSYMWEKGPWPFTGGSLNV